MTQKCSEYAGDIITGFSLLLLCGAFISLAVEACELGGDGNLSEKVISIGVSFGFMALGCVGLGIGACLLNPTDQSDEAKDKERSLINLNPV